MSHHRPFLALWLLAVAACVTAFVLHLAMRGRSMNLGYELGKARAEQARLREVRRVLELEVASYETPQRVEVVARTLLAMEPPSPSRILAMNAPIAPDAVAAPARLAAESTAKAQVPASAAHGAVLVAAGPVVSPPKASMPVVTPPKSALPATPVAGDATTGAP